jgi:hypothetical protein
MIAIKMLQISVGVIFIENHTSLGKLASENEWLDAFLKFMQIQLQFCAK